MANQGVLCSTITAWGSLRHHQKKRPNRSLDERFERLPRPVAVGTLRLLSAIAVPYRDVVPLCRSSATMGASSRCPRVGTRNIGFAAGLAGLGRPSDCHGFDAARRRPAVFLSDDLWIFRSIFAGWLANSFRIFGPIVLCAFLWWRDSQSGGRKQGPGCRKFLLATAKIGRMPPPAEATALFGRLDGKRR